MVRQSHPNLAVQRLRRMIGLLLPKRTLLIEIEVFHLVSWERPHWKEGVGSIRQPLPSLCGPENDPRGSP